MCNACGWGTFHSCVAWAKKALHALRWQNVRPESLYTKQVPGRSARPHAVALQDASASSVCCMACVTPQGVRRAPKAALHGMQREGKSSLSGLVPDELSDSELDWSRANANTAVASSSESSTLVVPGWDSAAISLL